MVKERKNRSSEGRAAAPERDLSVRLAPFLERGLLRAVPNRWQIFQGTVQMFPYVVSPDVTSEESYRPHLLAHPVVRQLFLIRHIGIDHFNVAAGLTVSLESLCRHLMLTWHAGMPTYDLQLVQTHPGGLHELRRRFQAVAMPRTSEERRLRRQAERLFPSPDSYFQQFLAGGGWINRAAAFDYPESPSEQGCLPQEFSSLTNFLNHCSSLPDSLGSIGALRVPAHFGRLAATRWRSAGPEGREGSA